MNETEMVFFNVFAFGVGWYSAYLVRNINAILSRWGALFGVFALCIAFYIVLLLGGIIAGKENVLISVLFGLGFFLRFFKQRMGE